jgi:hypothetical protein
MANNMPSRICRGDKVRLKDRATASKYGLNEDHVFVVQMVDKIAGSPRLYIPHPFRAGEPALLWARDCVLAWPRNCAERIKALGL